MSKPWVWKVKPGTPCKIGIIGSKEVGKTTLANLLNGRLKSLGASSDLVYESARNSPLPLNERTSIASTYWLLGTQIATEALMQATRQFTVCDRTVIDLIPFAAYIVNRQENSCREEPFAELQKLKILVKHYLVARPYDFLFYIPIRKELWKVFGEPSDPYYQAEIDRELRIFLQELQVNYHKLKELHNQERLEEIMAILHSRYRFSLEETCGSWLANL